MPSWFRTQRPYAGDTQSSRIERSFRNADKDTKPLSPRGVKIMLASLLIGGPVAAGTLGVGGAIVIQTMRDGGGSEKPAPIKRGVEGYLPSSPNSTTYQAIYWVADCDSFVEEGVADVDMQFELLVHAEDPANTVAKTITLRSRERTSDCTAIENTDVLSEGAVRTLNILVSDLDFAGLQDANVIEMQSRMNLAAGQGVEFERVAVEV